jgi:hypothetical protein
MAPRETFTADEIRDAMAHVSLMPRAADELLRHMRSTRLDRAARRALDEMQAAAAAMVAMSHEPRPADVIQRANDELERMKRWNLQSARFERAQKALDRINREEERAAVLADFRGEARGRTAVGGTR